MAGLARLRCTRIVIAHRLSTVADSDLILVMEQGAVVEAGTHSELIERNGLYKDLVSAQTAHGTRSSGVDRTPGPP